MVWIVVGLKFFSDLVSFIAFRLVCSFPQVCGRVAAPAPGLSALASTNSSPFQASQGSPCSRGLALTGKEALRSLVRMGRTCKRWNLPGPGGRKDCRTFPKVVQSRSPCPRAWCCSSASAGGWTSLCPRCGRPPSLPPSEKNFNQNRAKNQVQTQKQERNWGSCHLKGFFKAILKQFKAKLTFKKYVVSTHHLLRIPFPAQ